MDTVEEIRSKGFLFKQASEKYEMAASIISRTLKKKHPKPNGRHLF